MLKGAALLLLALATVAVATQAADLDAGGDLRLRQVFIGNVGLNDKTGTADRIFQRYRGRLWGRYAPADWLTADARLI